MRQLIPGLTIPRAHPGRGRGRDPDPTNNRQDRTERNPLLNYERPPPPDNHQYKILIMILCCLIIAGIVAFIVMIGLMHSIMTTTSTLITVPSTTTTTTTTTTTATTTTITKKPTAKTSTTTPESVCFNGNSTVMKSDGAQVYMRDLKVDDEVLVVYQSSDGSMILGYSRLLALDIYQKWDKSSSIDYLEIHTETKNNEGPLYITPAHSLLVRKNHQSEKEYLFASEVEIGDYLYLTTNNYQSVIEVQITQINDVKQFDAYAPLTFEGNIVVNNRIASCYGTFSHSIGHLVKMPRRYWLHFCLKFQFV